MVIINNFFEELRSILPKDISDVPEKIKHQYSFIKNLIYDETLENQIVNSNLYFSAYYDTSLSINELMDYFNEYYKGENKKLAYKLFILYAIVKKSCEIYVSVEIFKNDGIEEGLKIVEREISDVEILMSEILKIQAQELEDADKEREKNELIKFLNSDNKYMIFFAGRSYNDIVNLPKSVLKSLMYKLYEPLSTQDMIEQAESISHTNSLYNVSFLRIHMADDYRIAFFRHKGSTIIIGVELKSGKDKDYTRYDSVAKQIRIIYEQLQDFIDGKIDDNSTHNLTLKYIYDVFDIELEPQSKKRK